MRRYNPVHTVITAVLCISISYTTTADDNDIHGFWSKFGTPYQNAIQILANDALKPLADAKVPNQSAEAEQLLTNSKTHFQRFFTALEPMRAASAELKQQQDQRIVNKILELQQLENAMNETDRQLASATADLNQNTQALVDAQVKLAQEQGSSRNAHMYLQSQMQNLGRVENCIWKLKRSPRERRGFFDDIGKGLGNVYREVEKGFRNVGREIGIGANNVVTETRRAVNLPCRIGGAVNSAREAVHRAEENVRHQEQRTAEQQTKVNNAQNTVNQLRQTKTQQEQRKQQLDGQIVDMRNKLNALVELNTKVKQVIVYLSSLFAAGQTLRDVMQKMINIAELLDPLQYITEKIVAFGGHDTAALQATTEGLRQSMVTLNAKLPEYPLLENGI